LIGHECKDAPPKGGGGGAGDDEADEADACDRDFAAPFFELNLHG
jgi:hypothetical protein